MIVIDSSSLILLAKIGILDIVIKSIKQKLTVPEQVYSECTSKKTLFDAQIIEKRFEERSIARKDIQNRELYNKVLKDFNLGRGEAEAICLCIEFKAGIITDDKKAINACKILKIKIATAPKLLIQLYKKNFITKVEADLAVEQIQKFGRYSDEIINKLKEDLE